jgi:hypothetical protein
LNKKNEAGNSQGIIDKPKKKKKKSKLPSASNLSD